MVSLIRQIPRWLETLVVLTAAFGLFITGAFAEISEPMGEPYTVEDFLAITTFEIAVGATLLAFLFVRDWRLSDLGFHRPTVSDAVHVALLVALILAIGWIAWIVTAPPPSAFQDAVANGQLVDADGIGIVTAIFFSLINGAYEEVFVCTYIIAAWRSPSMPLAIALSVAVRMSYHVYQGAGILVTVLPFAIVAAVYFARTRRIAPLIAVHFLFDLLALLPYTRL